MPRSILTLAVAVSLVLFLGVVVIALRSFGTKDTVEYCSNGGRLLMLISKSGRLDVLYVPRWNVDELGLSHRTSPAPFALGGTDYSRRFLGFGTGSQPNGGRFVNVPYWALAVLAAVPPLAVTRRLYRRSGPAAGVCAGCGYDLRATPDRCPECGAAPAKRPQAAA